MLKHPDKHSSAQAIFAFSLVILAFCIFILFYVNQDNIIFSGSFKPFVFLVTVGLGLMLVLMYLVSESHPDRRKASARKKKR